MAVFEDIQRKSSHGFLRDLFNRIPHPIPEKRPIIPLGATVSMQKKLALKVSCSVLYLTNFVSSTLIIGVSCGQESVL